MFYYSINLLEQLAHSSSSMDELSGYVSLINQEVCSLELFEKVNREAARRRLSLDFETILKSFIFKLIGNDITQADSDGESGIFLYNQDGDVTISNIPTSDALFEVIGDNITPL